MEQENLSTQSTILATILEGPVNPRCLSAIPEDIEELLQEFKKQEL